MASRMTSFWTASKPFCHIVGSNNSGKTSATEALQLFLKASKEKFSIYDFSSSCWDQFDAMGEQLVEGQDISLEFPEISLDLWFDVNESDLHRVISLLPDLSWQSSKIGVRLVFAPQNTEELKSNFLEAKRAADETVQSQEAKKAEAQQEGIKVHRPWPKSLRDFITKELSREYTIHYFVLDYTKFDMNGRAADGYSPAVLDKGKGKECEDIIKSLIRIDVLNAQRHLTDSEGSARSEDLSRRLSRFYDRNLENHEDVYEAKAALAEAEEQLNDHLKTVFQPTLKKLNSMGYPGFSEPHLEVKSSLSPENVLSKGTEVHYRLGDPGETESKNITLPDKYNGLGFKNLIYMVIEVLDFQARWMDTDEAPLLHLVVIEEPEAHLHAQLQQVFIRQIWEVFNGNTPEGDIFANQLIVTTHSAHIIYESGFTPIRYFRRSSGQQTETLNLSKFQPSPKEGEDDGSSLKFLQQYMKLTHCDLFFADAAILVEGNVERLLLPLMIEKTAPELRSMYLSILEVGGAFAHKFKELIEFIGLTALVITDLDSVEGQANAPAVEDEENVQSGTVCMPSTEGAVTSNQTLISWLPGLLSVEELLAAPEDKKTQPPTDNSTAHVRVAYQTRQPVAWNGEESQLAARTLEEAFALENLDWVQELRRKSLKLRVITENDQRTLNDVVERIHKRVSGSGFKKTDFALRLMTEDQSAWNVPAYISEGLRWLVLQLEPPAAPVPEGDNSQAAA